MLFMKCVATALLLTVSIAIAPVFCDELSGWIKGDTCWVIKAPSADSKIIGIIKKKAAVTVEDAEDGWLKIVFAPVREDSKTEKWIECTGCYIQEKNFTTTLPNKW